MNMNEDDIVSALERIGYSGKKLESIRIYVSQIAERKLRLLGLGMTEQDILSASVVFDAVGYVMKNVRESSSPRKEHK